MSKLVNKILRESSGEKDESFLNNLRPLFAKAAQKIYDEWEQDENGEDAELGAGGICQDIASAISDVLNKYDIECSTVSQQIDDQHVYTVCKIENGVFEVDISPYTYEEGGGYTWRKIPDVIFTSRDVIINCLSRDPEEFYNYIEE